MAQISATMVARHFLDEEELVALLAGQPEMDEKAARMLVLQVQQRDDNPPHRQQVIEWQSQQEFPICPTPDDPNSCNVYRELQFPQQVYDHVKEAARRRCVQDATGAIGIVFALPLQHKWMRLLTL